MDTDHARRLLAAERQRIEQALAVINQDEQKTGSEESEPGERDSEQLYQTEFDSTRSEDLNGQLAAVERAEARIEAGTYGLSVESSQPIPDERLEALPTAERTIEEQEALGG
jgi:DnaK suppressor protein